MKGDIDIEMGSNGNGTPTTSFPGIKLPNDGKIGFFNLPPRLVLSKQLFVEWISKSREKIRPWSTFFSTSRFKSPASAQRLPRRVVQNVEYFQTNYLFVFVGLILFCLLTSPLLLLAVLGSLSICYWIYRRNAERRVTLMGHELTITQQYSLVGLCSMPVFYLVGAGAAMFWVLGVSCFLIMTHAIFYDSQSLVEPEEESFELTMEQVV